MAEQENKKEPLWKKTRIGVPKYTDPEQLWKEACEYFSWCDGNPVNAPNLTTIFRKDKKQVIDETKKQEQKGNITRPYTVYGLCAFTGISHWPSFKNTYLPKEGFEEVISAIENVIASQQIDGALTGVFKENLASRLNGLADKQLQEVQGDIDITGHFNGFAFLPHTEGLQNSEQSKIASGEITPEKPEPEPIYAEIVDYEEIKNVENGRAAD